MEYSMALNIQSEQVFFWIIGTIVVILFALSLKESLNNTEEEVRQQHLRNQCSSKARGSRPYCWSEDDWKAFCEHVECKSQSTSHKE